MRILQAVWVMLGLVGVARCSEIGLDRRYLGRPSLLPPAGHGPVGRAKPATNITLPLQPTTTPTSPPDPVPTPMDLSISYALSSSCLLFLTSVLSNPTFTSCLPLSLLLTTSTSFSSLLASSLSSGDLTTLNELLAYTASPRPSSDECDEYFAGVHAVTTSKANCAADLAKGKSAVAQEAKAGIGGYAMMRTAGGLIDPDTGVYCYLQAVARPTADDLYLWSIPAGISPPSTSTPTCSKCSALLLNHFSGYQDSTPSLNGTIVRQAIGIVNSQCGPTFANYNAEPMSSGAMASVPLGGMSSVVGLGLALFVMGL